VAVDVVGYSRLAGSELLAQRLLGLRPAQLSATRWAIAQFASKRQPDLARAA